jgi:hypothetical protein
MPSSRNVHPQQKRAAVRSPTNLPALASGNFLTLFHRVAGQKIATLNSEWRFPAAFKELLEN